MQKSRNFQTQNLLGKRETSDLHVNRNSKSRFLYADSGLNCGNAS